MEQEEFNRVLQFGVETNGRGIYDPVVLGCETEREAKRELAKTFSAPVRAETHIYRVSSSPTDTRLVGINATSKEHADEILEWRLQSGLLCEEHLGELNQLLDTDQEDEQ